MIPAGWGNANLKTFRDCLEKISLMLPEGSGVGAAASAGGSSSAGVAAAGARTAAPVVRAATLGPEGRASGEGSKAFLLLTASVRVVPAGFGCIVCAQNAAPVACSFKLTNKRTLCQL